MDWSIQNLPSLSLMGLILVSFLFLAKGADWLVQEAVALSVRWGIPKSIIGATIISLGTTLPETTVSSMAALQGNSDMALGNAIGSIICNAGLILGLASWITPLPVDQNTIRWQQRVQLGSAAFLILACLPWHALSTTFISGGRLSKSMGLIFLGLTAAYLWLSFRKKRGSQEAWAPQEFRSERGLSDFLVVVKLAFAIGMVVGSSRLIIPAVSEVAVRLGVPDGIVAATMVAFGTSLPELVTAVTSAMKGHGEIGLGNVMGANILNALLVTGAAAAIADNGLSVPPYFFRVLFPAMLLVLGVLNRGISASNDNFSRTYGGWLLGIYIAVTTASYILL
ncbi:MAG: hypothetical protein A3G41_03695 [Elusimicrobia bacterium RIFCSPLOWO2_12_FULL_59_9]|nr:MAG: hypothetical protein A3G41_03695 [Elusimicrobia bacterium RIFCSPLOWO2_12_FULL_59_9]